MRVIGSGTDSKPILAKSTKPVAMCRKTSIVESGMPEKSCLAHIFAPDEAEHTRGCTYIWG